jgi:hypothetical protein
LGVFGKAWGPLEALACYLHSLIEPIEPWGLSRRIELIELWGLRVYRGGSIFSHGQVVRAYGPIELKSFGESVLEKLLSHEAGGMNDISRNVLFEHPTFFFEELGDSSIQPYDFSCLSHFESPFLCFNILFLSFRGKDVNTSSDTLFTGTRYSQVWEYTFQYVMVLFL